MQGFGYVRLSTCLCTWGANVFALLLVYWPWADTPAAVAGSLQLRTWAFGVSLTRRAPSFLVTYVLLAQDDRFPCTPHTDNRRRSFVFFCVPPSTQALPQTISTRTRQSSHESSPSFSYYLSKHKQTALVSLTPSVGRSLSPPLPRST